MNKLRILNIFVKDFIPHSKIFRLYIYIENSIFKIVREFWKKSKAFRKITKLIDLIIYRTFYFSIR